MHFQGIGDKMGLTGSDEVHNLLGSLKLPRRFRLPAGPQVARFRKLGYRGIAPY